MAYLRSLLLILFITRTMSYDLIQKLPVGVSSSEVTSIDWDTSYKRYIVPHWDLGSIYGLTVEETSASGIPFNNTAASGFTPNNYRINPSIPMVGWTPTRGDINDDKYYNVDMREGRVAIFDLTTDNYVKSIFVKTENDTIPNLNGICHDPDNPNMIYVVDNGQDLSNDVWFDTGFEAVYSLNLDDIYDTDNSTDGLNTIYDAFTYVEGAQAGYTIKGGDCVVNHGILYILDNMGMSMYNIAKQEWSVNTDVVGPRTGGDSLIYIDEIKTFYTTSVDNGTLSKYNPEIDTKFQVVYEGMMGPSDIAYNSDERILAITARFTTFVNFIGLDDELFTTTTKYFPTTTTKYYPTTTTKYYPTTTVSINAIGTVDSSGMIVFMLSGLMSLFMVLLV